MPVLRLLAPCVLVVALTGCGGPSTSTAPPPGMSAGVNAQGTLEGPYAVASVVDGDTVRVVVDGREIKVRLIGINTPETVATDRPVECFGPEASQRAKELLSGQQVYLEKDPATGETDKYGRTLAYVFLSPDQMVNEALVREGFAYEYTYDREHPYRYQQQFRAAQKSAQEQDLGLWQACPN